MKNTKLLNFILSTLSGFVDTAVFVYMGGLFVAHVTGNFVLLGATLGRGLGAHADIGGEHASTAVLQLSSFPLFVLAVIAAAVIAGRAGGGRPGTRRLLAAATALFLLVTIAAFAIGPRADTASAMVLVVAMGLLNAAHRLEPGMGPPFTVMTGNVTGFAVALAHALHLAPKPPAPKSQAGTAVPASLAATLWTAAAPVAGFLAGCLLGALAQAHLGLGAMVVPVVLMTVALLVAV
ncbi:DUF1275 family protein [Methyloraptor flagellatus]|uniref:YoaK family protein n=1 Tax=Methyloraptor flagellatus TaxID=3162530 RepID=A0AAU7XDA2_9HYPH